MKYLMIYPKIVFIFIVFFLGIDLLAGRIVNRRVKEAPRVCATMNPDKMLSKGEKTVFGTEKYSVVIDREVSILNDLGQRKCNWTFDQLNIYGDITKFNYYIDEFKEYIYPYFKTENDQYTILKVSLNTCQIESNDSLSELEFPKCEKPKSRKLKSVKKKHVAKR